jgi:hypothetical protein
VIYIGAVLLCCAVYGGFQFLTWSIPRIIGAVRYRVKPPDDEPDILLTHEADPYLAVLDEEHADDWTAWTGEYAEWKAEQKRKFGRRRVEKFGGDR